MARLTLCGRVYLDTNIFIYALEGYPIFRTALTELFDTLDRHELSAVTSELTLAEVLVKPFLDQHVERQEAYLRALQPSPSLQIAPISRDILVAAARLRAETGMKLPDAIHAATARLNDCTDFLTNDARFTAIPGLRILLVSQL
jgi:predicted nucleic acid-binding protein